MSGSNLLSPVYLVDSTGTAVGIVGRDGREWLFPASLTAGAEVGGLQVFGNLLFDATDKPIGYSIFGREYVFAAPFTLNVQRGYTLERRPVFLDASGTPAGVKGNSNLSKLFAAQPAESGSGTTLPQTGNIAARFAADQITPQGDNTGLASWTDTVSGLAMVQATGANQPKYRTSRTGGKPAVQFAGSQWLAASLPALKTLIDGQTYSVLIVYSNLVTQANGMLFGNGVGGDSFAFIASNTTTGRYQNSPTTMAVPYNSTNQMTLGYSCQATQRYPQQTNAYGERLYAYGMCVHTSQSKCPATSSADGFFAIGATNSTGALSCKADIQEIIVWNTVLSELDWLAVETWVATKYAQTIPWTTANYLPVFDGDSITSGVGATAVSTSWSYLTAVALGFSLGQWTIQAIGGMTTRGMTLKKSDWSGMGAYVGKTMKVAAFEWYNEKNAGYSAAVAFSDMQSYCTAVRALANTKLCLGSTTGYNGDPDTTNRDVYNASLDTNFASMSDAYVAIHNNATIGTTGAYAAGSATYWFDIVHLKDAGYAVLAPLMTTGMQALP
jgi:hypothetical protein